jgi:hypothetical protein
MADTDLVKRNIGRMIDRNAPEAEIDSYISAEGMTPDQLRSSRSMLGRITGAIGDAASGVAESVRGKQDPRFADVPGFSFQGLSDLDTMRQIKRGQAVTYDDKAYGDIVKKALGDRITNVDTDANGYEVLTYKGDDGGEHRAYLNKPGLDWDDVERAVVGSAPFMVGAGVAGGLARGAGLLTRMGLQAAAGGASSIGADVAAEKMGSEQSVDLTRAGVSTLGGAVFEGLSPAVAATWRRFFGRRGVIAPDGQLTERGRREAMDAGLDAADMDKRMSREFADKAMTARDPAEVGASVRTGEFDLPTTKGTRTKLADQLGVEEEMRRGLMGKDAQEIMREFDKRVTTSVEDAAYRKVGGELAPNAPGRERDTLGRAVGETVRDKLAAARAQEHVVWRETGAMFPTDEGFERLPTAINDSLKKSGYLPNPNLGRDPQSNAMLEFLQAYKEGTLQEIERPLIGHGPSNIFLDDARRHLLTLYRGAEPRTADAKAAKAIYDGFNQWIDDLAENAALVGKPDMAAKLKVARAFTRDLHGLYEPRTVAGKLTPGGRVLRDVIDNEATPEGVVNSIFGAGGPTTAPPKGSVEALQQLKKILGDGDDWNNVRLAHWVKLAQDNRGQVLSPARLRNNIDAAFKNQPSVMNTLYGDHERRLMRRLSTALEDVTYKPPNASGTSYEAERLRQKYSGGSAVKTLLQTQSKRELFSKHNVIMSRVYQVLARKLPVSIFGSKEGAGAALARRATNNQLTPAVPPSFGGVGSAVGAEMEAGQYP